MEVVTWVGASAAFVTSIGILWRKVVKPIISWGMKLDRTMSFVEQQMHPNGGTSLRDSVNRIEKRLGELEELVTRPR